MAVNADDTAHARAEVSTTNLDVPSHCHKNFGEPLEPRQTNEKRALNDKVILQGALRVRACSSANPKQGTRKRLAALRGLLACPGGRLSGRCGGTRRGRNSARGRCHDGPWGCYGGSRRGLGG